MIEKIDTNRTLIKPEIPSRQPGSAKELTNNNADASLQVDYTCLVDKAMQSSQQADIKAVQRAQQLLSSGQLESPENIRAAAENIIKFGI